MFGRARRQLTLMYAATGVILFGVLAIGIYLVLVGFLDRELDDELEAVLEQGLSLYSEEGPGAELAIPVAFGPAFLFLFSPEGNVLRNPRDLPAYRVIPSGSVRQVAITGEGMRRTLEASGDRYRLLLEPIARDGEVVAVLVAGRSLARRDAEVRLVTSTLAGSLLVWVVFAAAAAYFVAGRALQPMRQAYARQEAFVAGAAHELRSPIGVIRTASDVALRSDPSPEVRALVAEINDVATDASALVDTLLDLARMRQQASADGATNDLAEVVGRELSRMELLLREHGVRVFDDLSSAVVAAPATEIGRITRALLENVIAHTPRGTTLIVRTRALATMGELVVEDDGPGVPEEELDGVFEPFSRGDEARSRGDRTGMGLAIVQSVAEYYGGRVRARRSERGGLVVEVQFPSA